MVHALNEAHRILIPTGILIDVRPLSVDVPLEVIYQGGGESAGMIDMSPDIELDRAADRAIESVLTDQLYRESWVENFDFPYYWKTFRDMKVDLDEYWMTDVIIPEEVLQRARILFRKRRPQTQILVRVRMKLGKYEKLED
jgi:hypothetical protein